MAKFMKRVRLKVRFFKKSLEGKWEEVCSDISKKPIIDIGSKDIGALELHDVNPLKVRNHFKNIFHANYMIYKNNLP